MFRSFEVWRHDKCLDLDLLILKRTYSGPDYLKVRVRFMNRHNKTFFLAESKIVKIERKDFKFWKQVHD